MKEGIGTTFIFNIVIVFTIIFIGLFVTAIAYSKGFKVKNRIIQIIERNDGYNTKAQEEIADDLQKIGYRIVRKDCGSKKGVTGVQETEFAYCTYHFSSDVYQDNSIDDKKVKNGEYYGVKVFVHFDIPLIGDFFELPIYGETRLLYMKDRVEG